MKLEFSTLSNRKRDKRKKSKNKINKQIITKRKKRAAAAAKKRNKASALVCGDGYVIAITHILTCVIGFYSLIKSEMNCINWLWWRVRSLLLSFFFEFIEFYKAEFQPQLSRMVICSKDSRQRSLSIHNQLEHVHKALKDFCITFSYIWLKTFGFAIENVTFMTQRLRASVKWTNHYNERYSSKFGIPHLFEHASISNTRHLLLQSIYDSN